MASLNIVETSTTTDDLTHSQLKARKGIFFVVDEERQLCCSFLHESQDSVIRNQQKFATFWDRMQNHFNESRFASCAPRFALSLETKWGIIKHDIAKFVGHYTIVLAFCESRTGTKDILRKALDLYKTKHPKHQRFTFVHVWYVLKKYFSGLTYEKK
jgi:hypothetical protein